MQTLPHTVRNLRVTVPDLVACWCDVHGPALHSASCCLGGCASPLRDSQSWGWCPLRRHQRVFALLAHIPISTDMAMAQSPWAGHILWDTVICGHFYGPMQRESLWQLGTKGEKFRVLLITLLVFPASTTGSAAELWTRQCINTLMYNTCKSQEKTPNQLLVLILDLLSTFSNWHKYKQHK